MQIPAASGAITVKEFVSRAGSITTLSNLNSLRTDAIDTENMYRELFARSRESWEIPEIDDPYVFLIEVFNHRDIFRRLPKFDDDTVPRCFALQDKRQAERSDAVVEDMTQFDLSWDCTTEGQLRFLNWDNVLAAGGAVAGCLVPLPEDIRSGGPSATRVKRRKYFHDKYLPGSDIDLFLYGLTESEAETKLQEIYDAVQAANPYEIRAFRSTHAITLVSQYPFRHVQIVLRLYNSPSEVLMGFDVDACAVGYNGKQVLVCPRTALALMTQSNSVDMSRRSPSYEMRLAKYAQRGFEVQVPTLERNRIDPFLFERRFDQVKGLARLLLLEKLRTPQERLRYKIEGKLRQGHNPGNIEWMIQRKLQQAGRDIHNLVRAEGSDGIVPPPTGPESSDYSTVFLPWGPEWDADRIERLTRKKDRMLNKIEVLPNGQVVKCRRPYKIHVCAVGTMEQVLDDPFPDDPPIPDDAPPETIESIVRGKLTWLVDNPGRQQIGSFHPITDEDWTEGAYFSRATEALIVASISDNYNGVTSLLNECKSQEEASQLLASRDFLGRSSLHVASLAGSPKACQALLEHPAADAEFLQSRLADGRTALHLAAIKGDVQVINMLLQKRKDLASKAALEGNHDEQAAAIEILDIDASDWEVKINALQYAVVLGHVEVVRILLSNGANARKAAVHKDRKESLSVLSLLALYAYECGENKNNFKLILELLLNAGASTAQVDTSGSTCWHHLAASASRSSSWILETFLEVDALNNNGKAQALDVLDSRQQTALYIATLCGSSTAVAAFLRAGAKSFFRQDDWAMRTRQVQATTGCAPFMGRFHSVGNLHRSYGNQQDFQRCPIFVAAANADGPCIQEFVSHDPSLAHVTIETNGRGPKESQMKPLKPLDVLEKMRSDILRENNMRLNQDRAQNQVKYATSRFDQAKKERDVYPKKSYQNHMWSLIACREGQALSSATFQAKEVAWSEEDVQEETEAIRQIDEACEVIHKACGGAPVKQNVPDVKQVWGSRANHQKDITLADPLHLFVEMQPLDFNTARAMMHYYSPYRDPSLLARTNQKQALDLMIASYNGDVAIIRKMSDIARVCIVDSVGVTPLMMALVAGSIDTVEAIFETAKRQFELYVQEQKSLQQPQPAEMEESSTQDVQAQLRRLNNLDIAAGIMPQDSGPTPDQMRQKLETAEAAALKQLETCAAVSSPVPPASLLLHRSIVLPDAAAEPGLLKIKTRLANQYPDMFSEDWITQPVKLRPIELAVLRADKQMVKKLLDFSTMVDARNEDEQQEREENDDEGEDTDYEEEDSDDYDGEYDEDYEEYARQRAINTVTSFTASQLRFLFAGEASRNPDLGYMTLPQLAIAVDNVPIFCEIASYAQEIMLPPAAIVSWKQQVDARDSSPVTEETKAKRVEVANAICGWERQHHATAIQFALSVGSENVSKALMTGEADEALLGWVMKSANDAKIRALYHTNFKGRVGNVQDENRARVAASWVFDQIRESDATGPELAYWLYRPTAKDKAGRTALFYTPEKMVSDVVNSAVEATLRAGKNSVTETVARSTFLESITTEGMPVTALMAAVGDGESDRVKALLGVGCDRAKLCGPKRWGPVHLAIPNHHLAIPNRHLAIPNQADETHRWTKAREIIELLLEGASDTELDEALLSPEAEHTPLMLAASRGGDAETISLLIKKTVARAVEGLARRDSELNSVLHLAVRAALNLGDGGTRVTQSNCPPMISKLDGVAALLEWPELPKTLGPNAENARGVTPSELALQSITSVWNRSLLMRQHQPGRTAQDGRQQRRQKLGKEPLPPQLPGASGDEAKETLEPFIGRRCLSLFDRVATNETHSQRLQVGFEEVQKATETTTEKVKVPEPIMQAPGSNRLGPPVLLQPSHYGPRDTGHGHQTWHGWNGWPQ